MRHNKNSSPSLKSKIVRGNRVPSPSCSGAEISWTGHLRDICLEKQGDKINIEYPAA